MANIILADDDPSIRHFLKGALERAGHRVVCCADGLAAFEALEKASYDLLLSDIVMPGMDGLELSAKAAKLYPAMKIILITGFAAMALNGTQALRVISKPFHLGNLVREIEEVLGTSLP